MELSIELHGTRTGNCFRAAIALEEAGLPYVVKRVDLRDHEQRDPAYLALNPRGKVPIVVAESPDGKRFVLTQSNAIMLYAAEMAPGRLLPIRSMQARARAYERFLYFVTDVIAPNHAAFAVKALPESRDASALLNARSLEALSAVESFLSESAFIAGDQFTLADISAYTITVAIGESLDWAPLPKMLRWYESVGARDAVRRGLHAFE